MKKFVFLSLCGLITASCLTPKKTLYVEDMRPESLYFLSRKPELKIQQDDRLRIVIASRSPELSAPFNIGVGGYQIGVDGDVRTTAGATPAAGDNGYVVDHSGNIEFPILGVLHVEGLTKPELSNLIRERLKQEELINDAMVTVDILNLKITVMGEVNSVGVLSVPDSRITLIEAITMAGGLTANASMEEVVVIRENEEGRRMLVNDLRTVEIFDSPGFYLQQNDIVYVKPKAPRRTERENRAWQAYSTALGLGSTILSILILFRTYR